MGFVDGFLLPIGVNIVIIIALFYLSLYMQVPVLLPFLIYGIITGTLALKTNITGIVTMFNHLGMLTGYAISALIFSPPAASTRTANIAWNMRARRISASLSVIFWLILGSAIQWACEFIDC